MEGVQLWATSLGSEHLCTGNLSADRYHTHAHKWLHNFHSCSWPVGNCVSETKLLFLFVLETCYSTFCGHPHPWQNPDAGNFNSLLHIVHDALEVTGEGEWWHWLNMWSLCFSCLQMKQDMQVDASASRIWWARWSSMSFWVLWRPAGFRSLECTAASWRLYDVLWGPPDASGIFSPCARSEAVPVHEVRISDGKDQCAHKLTSYAFFH